MFKFPKYIQHDAKDCGPACLKIISSYYGKNFSLDTLREMCYITKEGVSLLSISDAAEEIGFKTVGGKITYKKLVEQVPLPCIVHWKAEHFVVVYKIKKKNFLRKKDRIYLSDPEIGHIEYAEEEFLKHWIGTKSKGEEKGIALLFETTQDFYKNGDEKEKTRSNFKFLLSYFVKYRKFFFQLLIGLLIGSLIQLIFPFLTQSIVDIGIGNENLNFIFLVLIAQLTLFISRMSVDYIRQRILLHISNRINISLVSDFFIKLMKLPMNFFDSKLIGDIIQRMEDHRRVERFLTTKTLDIVFSAFNFIIFGLVLFIYNLNIFFIFLIGSFLYTFWILFFLKKRKQIDHKLFNQHAKEYSKSYQLIIGMQEIKLQNCEKSKRWSWEDIQADLFVTKTKALNLEQYRGVGSLFINETKNIIITIVAATSVINGELTLGMMLAIQYIIGQLNSPIERTVEFIHNLQDTRISLERINEIHQKKDENEERSVLYSNEGIKDKSIYIQNLTFRYEGPHSPKVLKNLNLKIPQGKVTAIVGTSGSGKTTLIKLLLQYYKPISGSITVGGINLNIINTQSWRKNCGVVMQEGYIFSESIAENIAASDDEIDVRKLIKATEIGNISEYINSLPLKYNTIIGEEGKSISHGQKQRILISRAVYKEPEYLFFDEATNSLDANNEKIIVNRLNSFFENKTVVVVAHRLSTVKNADQIVVLEKGEIIETGTHEQLILKKGAYYNLVKNQLELGS